MCVAAITVLGFVGASCSAGLPSEADALEGIAEAEVVAADIVLDSLGPDVVGDWEREFFDDACTLSCSACDEMQSAMLLDGPFTLDGLMTPLAEGALAAGGSAGEIELVGETYIMYLTAEGASGHEHRILVMLRGAEAATISLTTSCYRTATD
jgi:hypothetical protein